MEKVLRGEMAGGVRAGNVRKKQEDPGLLTRRNPSASDWMAGVLDLVAWKAGMR